MLCTFISNITPTDNDCLCLNHPSHCDIGLGFSMIYRDLNKEIWSRLNSETSGDNIKRVYYFVKYHEELQSEIDYLISLQQPG